MPSRSDGPVDPRLARASVLGAVAVLQALDGWEPVGALLEDVRMALAGEGGLTGAQLTQLTTWARRWRLLDPRLQALYRQHVSRGAVQAALWLVLAAHRPSEPSGAVYGSLRELWAELYGYPPSIELVPFHSVRLHENAQRG